MTLRIVNDDARCRFKDNCHISAMGIRKLYGICSECGERKLGPKIWETPPGFEDRYGDLLRKVGTYDARRIVKREAGTA